MEGDQTRAVPMVSHPRLSLIALLLIRTPTLLVLISFSAVETTNLRFSRVKVFKILKDLIVVSITKTRCWHSL